MLPRPEMVDVLLRTMRQAPKTGLDHRVLRQIVSEMPEFTAGAGQDVIYCRAKRRWMDEMDLALVMLEDEGILRASDVEWDWFYEGKGETEDPTHIVSRQLSAIDAELDGPAHYYRNDQDYVLPASQREVLLSFIDPLRDRPEEGENTRSLIRRFNDKVALCAGVDVDADALKAAFWINSELLQWVCLFYLPRRGAGIFMMSPQAVHVPVEDMLRHVVLVDRERAVLGVVRVDEDDWYFPNYQEFEACRDAIAEARAAKQSTGATGNGNGGGWLGEQIRDMRGFLDGSVQLPEAQALLPFWIELCYRAEECELAIELSSRWHSDTDQSVEKRVQTILRVAKSKLQREQL